MQLTCLRLYLTGGCCCASSASYTWRRTVCAASSDSVHVTLRWPRTRRARRRSRRVGGSTNSQVTSRWKEAIDTIFPLRILYERAINAIFNAQLIWPTCAHCCIIHCLLSSAWHDRWERPGGVSTAPSRVQLRGLHVRHHPDDETGGHLWYGRLCWHLVYGRRVRNNII